MKRNHEDRTTPNGTLVVIARRRQPMNRRMVQYTSGTYMSGGTGCRVYSGLC